MQSKAEKVHINLVVIGHVDSGKSTTTGHLIFKLGQIDERKLQKLEKQSVELGKGDSCKFAFLMDTSKEEQKRGITINTATAKFETKKYNFTIIDAPGHKDFIKNMISGTAQADVAMLMVSAVQGEFEAGFSKDGTTKEHALLAYTLGVKQVIVCVNKMDEKTVNFSEQRYLEIKEEVQRWLKKIGFVKADSINFVPISAFCGENLVERSGNNAMEWYKGPTLIEALNMLTPPVRFLDKALRIPINEIYKIQGIGTVISGRIEMGTVTLGQQVEIAPLGIKGEVKSIEMHHDQLKQASAGDCVGINVRGIGANDVKKGYVMGDAKNDTPKETVSFVAQIIITNHPGQIKNGYTPIIDCHTSHIACKFEKILSKIDKKTNQVIEENPAFLESGDCALIRIVPLKAMVVEEFALYPPLGRLSVRDSNKSVAVGIVKSVVKKM